jgi:hypothetical protein
VADVTKFSGQLFNKSPFGALSTASKQEKTLKSLLDTNKPLSDEIKPAASDEGPQKLAGFRILGSTKSPLQSQDSFARLQS